jgi:hypothetical protein
MHRLISVAEAFARLFGFDLFIEADDPRLGLFDFAHQAHASGDRELWGLGLHIVAGPIRHRVPA